MTDNRHPLYQEALDADDAYRAALVAAGLKTWDRYRRIWTYPPAVQAAIRRFLRASREWHNAQIGAYFPDHPDYIAPCTEEAEPSPVTGKEAER